MLPASLHSGRSDQASRIELGFRHDFFTLEKTPRVLKTPLQIPVQRAHRTQRSFR